MTIPWAPELTTVEQPGAEKGRLAGEMINRLLAGEDVDDVSMVATLRVGATTGPAPLVGLVDVATTTFTRRASPAR